jgi:hypothetical protein
VRERRRERMRVLEEEERERMHRMLSLKRQQSTSTLPEAPLSPLTFSNPFAGDSPLEDGLTSPIGDVGVVRAPSTGAVSLHPSIHPSIASSSSSDYQLPPRTQEEERRRYLETRRALEPSATSHITITTTRSSAVPFLSATSYSPSSGLTPQQHRQSLAASTLSIGSIRRSASPSSISSVHTHAQGLRPSTSFHSQSQQRSGYGEHVRSPSEQGGRELAVGSPSEESFGGYWRGLGSSPSEWTLFFCFCFFF